MVLVPAPAAFTIPVAFTEATAGADDNQGLTVTGVPVLVSCVVEPRQAVKVPVIEGRAFTVIVVVMAQPLLFV